MIKSSSSRKHHVAASLLLLLILIHTTQVVSYRVVATATLFSEPLLQQSLSRIGISCYAAIEDEGSSKPASKWLDTIDESAEKLESVKAAASSLLLGA